MRRWFTLLLLVLLPLQFTWSAAAAYCQHEAAPSAQHVGHHAHDHAGAQPDADRDAPSKPAKFSPDTDCGYCHLTALKPPQVEPLGVVTLPDRDAPRAAVNPLQTRGPDPRERPNWWLA